MSVFARPSFSPHRLVTSRLKCRSLSRSLSRPLSITARVQIPPRRSQDFNSGFTSSYDPNEDSGRGPMFKKANFGVPQFYPRDLKRRVDEFVVGQDRAKKSICSAMFNHYQGLRRRHHQDESVRITQERVLRQQHARDRDLHDRRRDHHPIEDDFLGHHEYVRGLHQIEPSLAESVSFFVPEDSNAARHVRIDKSNLLLIGPTGVGKTYILETLSKQLNVPFTISDCNSFTQAGYIGQDVEACIERLLIESNYDVKATEHGVVVLDEFDKIARRETINGRDVGGEGVQQALLKLVEGAKVTINVKDNRSSRSASPITSNYGAGPSSPSQQSPPPSSGKVDQYTIDTSNIMFVFCGAFVGLDKLVLRRVSKPSIGFSSEPRTHSFSSPVLPRDMYAHLPHQPAYDGLDASGFTPLDLTTPADLQTFGFIPELIGRLHNICALTPLSLDELLRILTEPRNSLVAQYTALFETYPSRLYFTRRALRAIAKRAAKNETGARGLKMEMERVLAEPMFDAPTHYVLVTEACVKGTDKALYWGKDGLLEVERRMRDEDDTPPPGPDPSVASFEQFREAGQSGA